MDQQTVDAYNKRAKEYDEETADFWEQFPRTFIDHFVRLSGKNILNVGSGPGRDALLLRKNGKEVVCLDVSESMVRLSSEKGFHSVHASFEKLPFENVSFDAVWAYTSLLHVPKDSIEVALREIYRVLAPSGIFALGLIEGSAEKYRVSSGVDMPRLFSFYQKEEVEHLVIKYGFKLLHFESFKPRSYTYLNFIFRKI